MKLILVKVGAAVAILVLGIGIGKYTLPAKVITVEKEVQVEKRDVTTKTTRTKNPDGSSTTTRITEDKTIIDTEKNKQSVVINAKPNYLVGASIGYDFRQKEEVWAVQVQKRIAGPVFIGVQGIQAASQETGLITLTMEF